MGVVKGRVINRVGSPVAGATVRGRTPGMLGYSIDTKSDRDGHFVLNYSGDGKLEYISVDGGERQSDIRSGSTVTLYK